MSWQAPSEAKILQVVDGTWPAARYFKSGPFILRLGQGGGQRVSAASANGSATAGDIAEAETEMRDINQARLFMITSKDAALDQDLDARGYKIKDPVTMFAAPIETLASRDEKGLTVSRADAPLEIMKDIWAAGGIEQGRLDVMARASGPKTFLIGRLGDQPVGAAFVAIHGETAMLHALEVQPTARRNGLGLSMTAGAAAWAADLGAKTFSLIAVTNNTAACGLYRHLGMTEVGHYHYRKKD